MKKFFASVAAVGFVIGISSFALADEKQDMIDDATSAAPASISGNATIMDWDGNKLVEGENGYTCFPTPPNLTGKAPMCLDAAWLVWADAWMNRKPLEARSFGTAYMLAGDGGASNIDPYAEGPTADNEWVVEGPHLMIIVLDAASLDTLPTDPKNGGPYVMWKGTPYAHVMVPVGE